MKKSRWDRDIRQSIGFTLNRADHEKLEALAKKAGLNNSEMVRKLIADASGRDANSNG